MATTIQPVILSGGTGTRLWPLSRAMYPKQFIPSLNGGRESLLGATLKRLAGDSRFAAPILLCNNDHRFVLRMQINWSIAAGSSHYRVRPPEGRLWSAAQRAAIMRPPPPKKSA